MCASPLRFLRAGPPPPKVAFLPDGMFFVRALPVTPGATAVEAAAQLELGLEAIAPFPLAQLYYGWFWRGGAETALVFAAYRRRFTAEQSAAWAGAELVLPSFASVLGATVEPATTIVLTGADEITAVHWTSSAAPSHVLVRALPPEATEDDRVAVRAELVRGLGGSQHVIDLAAPLASEPARSDRELIFRAGDFVSRLPAATAAALDVRDKADLAALRNARRRDVVLWSVALGAAAALGLLLVGEIALVGGRAWQKVRLAQFNAQKPLVEKITGLHELGNRIDEIATKRMLPWEMIIAAAEAKPGEIVFTRAVADRSKGLTTLVVGGTTANPGQVNVYEAALRALPGCESAVATIDQLRNDRTTFNLTVVFKTDGLKPLQPAAPAASSQ
jgi:hypothetical protein